MKRITVQFTETYPPYAIGEKATFFEREANRLIDRGFAMYAGGDEKRETQADRLKALRGAPETRHIPGPAETRDLGPDATKTHVEGNRPSQVEGAGNTRKCGLCGKPGHTRANCPTKK